MVSGVGKGRHTTTAALALPLDRGGGWVVDTPGMRSFGLAHVGPDDVVAAFGDLAEAIEPTARADAAIWGRPPTRSALWTTWSPPDRSGPADSMHCVASSWR